MPDRDERPVTHARTQDIALPPGPPGPPPAPPYAPGPPPVPPGVVMRTPQQHLQEMAKKYKVDPLLAESIMRVESGGQQTNPDGSVKQSPQGAQGFFQLLPSTAFGEFNLDPKDRFQNIEAGIRYLRKGIDHGDGTVQGVASFYHGGPNSQQWGTVTKKYAEDVENDLRQQLDARDAAAAQPPAKAAAPPAAPPAAAPAAAPATKPKSGDWAKPENLAQASAGPPPQPWYIRGGNALVDTGADLAKGAAKGMASTTMSIGDLVNRIPGALEAGDKLDELFGVPGLSERMREERDQGALEASNTTQSIGKGAEQIAELLVPASKVNKAATAAERLFAPKLAGYMGNIGKTAIGETVASLAPRVAVEAAGGAGMAAAQGGDAKTGAVFGAVAPVLGDTAGALAEDYGPKLVKKAGKLVEQAFKGGKEYYKALVQKHVPEILKRGLTGTRDEMIETGDAARKLAGAEIDRLMQAHGQDRFTGSHTLLQKLEDAKDQFRSRIVKRGKAKFIEANERAIAQLEKLQQKVAEYGHLPTLDDMRKLRQNWDNPVGKAGGYAQRARGKIGQPFKEETEVWAKREGANYLRELIGKDIPEIVQHNKDYSFWKDITDSLRQTEMRTGPHESHWLGSLARGAARVGGAGMTAAGLLHGDSMQAVEGLTMAGAGELVKRIEDAVRTPQWRMMSAHIRYEVSKALGSGDTGRLAEIATMVLGAHEAAPPPPPPPPSLAPDYGDLWGTITHNPKAKGVGGPPPPPGRNPGEVYATVPP